MGNSKEMFIFTIAILKKEQFYCSKIILGVPLLFSPVVFSNILLSNSQSLDNDFIATNFGPLQWNFSLNTLYAFLRKCSSFQLLHFEGYLAKLYFLYTNNLKGYIKNPKIFFSRAYLKIIWFRSMNSNFILKEIFFSLVSTL